MKYSPIQLLILLSVPFFFLGNQDVPENRTKQLIPENAMKGDFNGDGRPEYMWLIAPTIDSAGMNCIGECTSSIQFSDPSIPSIIVEQCIGGDPVNLGDLNRNGTDEVGLLQEWFTSCWTNYHVWTLKNRKWVNAVKPFPTHCDQWQKDIQPIEIDKNREGYVIIRYSEHTGNEIVTRTRTVNIVK